MLQRSLLRSILIGISRCFRKVGAHIDLCKPFNLAGPVAVVRHGVLAGGWPSGGRIRARPLAGQFGEQVPVIVIARKQTNPRSLFRLRLFRFHQAVSAKPPEDETKHRRLQSRVPSAVPSVHQHHLTEQTRPRHTRRTLPVQEVFKPPLSHFWPLTFKFSAFNHLQAEMAPVLAKLGRQCGSSRPPRARARPPSSRWPW